MCADVVGQPKFLADFKEQPRAHVVQRLGDQIHRVTIGVAECATPEAKRDDGLFFFRRGAVSFGLGKRCGLGQGERGSRGIPLGQCGFDLLTDLGGVDVSKDSHDGVGRGGECVVMAAQIVARQRLD